MLIARHDKAIDRKNTAIHRTVKILEMTKARSIHFPKIICYGRLKKVKVINIKLCKKIKLILNFVND